MKEFSSYVQKLRKFLKNYGFINSDLRNLLIFIVFIFMAGYR